MELTRRTILGGIAGTLALTSCARPEPTPTTANGGIAAEAATADDALTRLKAGNARFVQGTPTHPNQTPTRRTEISDNQHPFAQILTCADSRVSPELIFDQGLGDLFVTRSAGQVVDHALMGTIEFGAAELNIPLLIILGHSHCGAVQATIEAMETKATKTNTDIDALIAAITPAVQTAAAKNPEDLLAAAIKQNVTDTVDHLNSANLHAVGAVYDLKTGKVTFT